MLHVLVVSVLIMSAMASVEHCPGGFPSPSDETKCFKMVSEKTSYGKAVQACMAMPNHNLAEISDPLENDELQLLILVQGAAIDEEYLWIGLVDNNGTWEWLNGEKLAFSNWAQRFPRRGFFTVCGALNTLTGGWENHDCRMKYPYFCSNQQYGKSSILRKLSVLLRAKSR
ncbi:unnamed protein product [Anisakis simplex]|uniref:C-type lectin domain-containing protein n=1 Tax=Anisakis simplex TaxID=6269 RepID=A0A0M3K4E7_ANISI|nr:unnamed protein product [Anisakis simplex]